MIAKLVALMVLIVGYYLLITKYWWIIATNLIFNPMLALFIFLLPLIVSFGIAMIFGR